MKVKHKFLNNILNKNGEILIIGTFNPNVPKNESEYFYGRNRNYLWKILPFCFNEKDLKGTPTKEKIKFADKHKIGFVDLIKTAEYENLDVDYDDKNLDNRIVEWTDVEKIISDLPKLKKIAFTRKTYKGIPNVKARIENIKKLCIKKNIAFKALETPSRFYSEKKLNNWKEFINN